VRVGLTLLLAAFVALQVLDIITTFIGLRVGCAEVNSMHRTLGQIPFFLLKMVFVIYAIAALRLIPDLPVIRRTKRLVLTVLVTGALLTVLWSVAILLQT